MTRRKRKAAPESAPEVTLADYFRWKLTRPGAAFEETSPPTVEDFENFAKAGARLTSIT